MPQLKVWIGLFIISLSAGLLVIVGRMLKWTVPVSVPLAAIGVDKIDLVHILNGLIGAALALMILRGFSVGRGIISLLKLSADIAVSEARSRDEARYRIADEEIHTIGERQGYGEYVDLSHS